MSNNKLIDPEIKKQIIDRIKGGNASVSQVTKEYGISDNTIYGWLKKETKEPDSVLEIRKLKRENQDLLLIIGELTKEISQSKKNRIS